MLKSESRGYKFLPADGNTRSGSAFSQGKLLSREDPGAVELVTPGQEAIAKSVRRKNLLPLISCFFFSISIILLLVYLLRIRLYNPLPQALFWVSIIIPILIILLQIFRIPWQGYRGILIAELVVLAIAINAIYKIPLYSFAESDSFYHMMISKTILKNGFVMVARLEEAQESYWPLLRIGAAQLSLLTGISIFSIAKWLPSLLMAFIAFILYVFIGRLFDNQKVAFLTALLVVTSQHFQEYGAKFHYEIFSLVIMLTFLFCLVKPRINKQGLVFISVLLFSGLMLSHHLTPTLLVFLLILQFIFTYLLVYFTKNHTSTARLGVNYLLILLVLVGLFSYWIYISGPIFFIFRWLKNLFEANVGTFTPAQSEYVINPASIVSLRGKIIFYGFYSYLLIFTSILIYHVLARPKKQPEFYSFTSYLFVMGLLGFINMYLQAYHIGFSPARVMIHGWLIGFAPLAYCFLSTKPEWKRGAGMILLAGFMVLNIYMTPPHLWDLQYPGREEGNITLREDYALAESMNFTGKVASYHRTRLAIYDIQGFYSKDLNSIPDIEELERMAYIVVKKKELVRYNELRAVKNINEVNYDSGVGYKLVQFLTGAANGRNKIYDSGNLVVLK